jgi:3-oxoacyl-[acyl-carrier protein] reductase
VPLETGLRGARVLVTAASRGIGFGAAKAFLREGARVVVNSSNPERLDQAVRALRPEGEVYGIVADLRREADLDRLHRETLERLGGMDALVYVAGPPRPGVVLDQGYGDWEEAARLLVVSPAYLARQTARSMIAEQHAGRMVFLASFTVREPAAHLATSSVCRIAVAGLVRTLAREVGPNGIRVNGILPGHIATDRAEELLRGAAERHGSSVETERCAVIREVPLGRIGTTEELAQAILFLGSDLSSYVTGTLLPVDGGLLRSVG